MMMIRTRRDLWKHARSATRQLACYYYHHHSQPQQQYQARFLKHSHSRFHPHCQDASFRPRLFCSTNDQGGLDESAKTESAAETVKSEAAIAEAIKNVSTTLSAEDVTTAALVKEITKFYDSKGENLETLTEMVMRRALAGNHEDSDAELMEHLQIGVVDDVHDSEFEDGFSDACETDNELENLYNAPEYVQEKHFGEVDDINAEEYDEMLKELRDEGHVMDQQSLQDFVEDFKNPDRIFPADMRQKVSDKLNELRDKCDNGELEVKEALRIYKEFEDEVVEECFQRLPPEVVNPPDTNITNNSKDPPGEGPILKWETRVVLSPGGESWHPANRKVKLSVSVKELALSKYASKRLRELVGNRYNSGKNELTIVSERFAYREENRKDSLRTLYALIEEAQKADIFVEAAKLSYTKNRLKAIPQIQEKLNAHAIEANFKGMMPT